MSKDQGLFAIETRDEPTDDIRRGQIFIDQSVRTIRYVQGTILV